MELIERQRLELLDYALKIGFIYQSKPFNRLNKEQKLDRIRSLIKDGFRIQLWGDKLDVINVNGISICQEIEEEIKEIYYYLRKTDGGKE